MTRRPSVNTPLRLAAVALPALAVVAMLFAPAPAAHASSRSSVSIDFGVGFRFGDRHHHRHRYGDHHRGHARVITRSVTSYHRGYPTYHRPYSYQRSHSVRHHNHAYHRPAVHHHRDVTVIKRYNQPRRTYYAPVYRCPTTRGTIINRNKTVNRFDDHHSRGNSHKGKGNKGKGKGKGKGKNK
ncbi:MAG: hypothetical protein AAF078_12435 [Planctomycetota bacterium]